jgi:hypothetical protein
MGIREDDPSLNDSGTDLPGINDSSGGDSSDVQINADEYPEIARAIQNAFDVDVYLSELGIDVDDEDPGPEPTVSA